MKKITALLLCFVLLCICSVSVLADDVQVSTKVPSTHTLTASADGAKVFFEGLEGTTFTIERLSEPRILIRAESGKVIRSILLDGKDVTNELDGGYLTLDPIYEDKALTVTTENEPEPTIETYTVNGRVTLNGQPLTNVELELRSTLKTTTTDENGYFSFTEVEMGKHSLTAVNEEKVIGYLSFELSEDTQSNVTLLENGTYTVALDKTSAGVELNLVLNEAMGIIAPAGAATIAHPELPQEPTGSLWWLWLLIIIICIAVGIVSFITYRKKKAE